MAHGSSQQHLTCSFMPACLRSRTLVDTKVLLYVLCRSAGPMEGCSAVLAVRRYYGFRSLVCASWCSEEKKHVQKQKLRCFFLGGHTTRRADTATIALPPRRASRLVLCHTHTHTRALPAARCYGVAVLRLVVVLILQLLPVALSFLLSSLVTKNGRKKKRHKKVKKAKNFGKVLFPNN